MWRHIASEKWTLTDKEVMIKGENLIFCRQKPQYTELSIGAG